MPTQNMTEIVEILKKAEAAKKEEARLKAQTKASGPRWPRLIPKMEKAMDDAGLERWRFPEILAKMATGEVREKKGVVLCGCTGNGKSTRMRLAERLLLIPMKRASVMSEMINENYSRENFEDIANLPVYANCSPHQYDLIIDELGSENSRYYRYGNKTDIMASVIMARYECFPKWKTHFTTNFTIDEIEQYYGLKIVSRLLEMCIFVPLPGDDRRRANLNTGF